MSIELIHILGVASVAVTASAVGFSLAARSRVRIPVAAWIAIPTVLVLFGAYEAQTFTGSVFPPYSSLLVPIGSTEGGLPFITTVFCAAAVTCMMLWGAWAAGTILAHHSDVRRPTGSVWKGLLTYWVAFGLHLAWALSIDLSGWAPVLVAVVWLSLLVSALLHFSLRRSEQGVQAALVAQLGGLSLGILAVGLPVTPFLAASATSPETSGVGTIAAGGLAIVSITHLVVLGLTYADQNPTLRKQWLTGIAGVWRRPPARVAAAILVALLGLGGIGGSYLPAPAPAPILPPPFGGITPALVTSGYTADSLDWTCLGLFRDGRWEIARSKSDCPIYTGSDSRPPFDTEFEARWFVAIDGSAPIHEVGQQPWYPAYGRLRMLVNTADGLAASEPQQNYMDWQPITAALSLEDIPPTLLVLPVGARLWVNGQLFAFPLSPSVRGSALGNRSTRVPVVVPGDWTVERYLRYCTKIDEMTDSAVGICTLTPETLESWARRYGVSLASSPEEED